MKNKKKQKNNKLIVGLAIIIALLIVASAYFVYFEPIEEEIVENVEERVIDDRISPLENQGLTLEILRIRHRGLHDKLATMGNSWKKTPSFYFVANIDGKEFETKKQTTFTTWDTMNQERKVLRDAKEEQETSTVELSIVEIVESGIIFKRYSDVEKDKLKVIYDYRTGRWDGGDDSFKDEDGTGHYVGETFEIWFNIYQTDIDGDAIPYWAEVNVINTNPRIDDSDLDPDEDEIPTSWEYKWGYDPNTWDDHKNLDPDIDGIENVEEYQMAKWLADPFHEDIYVEVDGMEKQKLIDVTHQFSKYSQQLLIERFCRHGICLYYDDGWPDGPVNGGGEILKSYTGGAQDAGQILEFYKHHFADERKGIFKYLLIGYDSPAFNHPAEFNRPDAMHVYNTVKLALGMKGYTQRTRYLYLATQAQHELGHSLGITPWSHQGCDNASYEGGKANEEKFLEDWGNYPSVMNYYFINQKDAGIFFILYDYSDGTHGPGDQNDWESLYLPTFQMEARVVEEYMFEFPPPKLEEKLDFELRGWNYDPELTEQFSHTIGDWSPVDPIPTSWFVFVKTDEANQPSDRKVRVYAQPDAGTTITGWTLSYEGTLDSEGKIDIYSDQDIVDSILSEPSS